MPYGSDLSTSVHVRPEVISLDEEQISPSVKDKRSKEDLQFNEH